MAATARATAAHAATAGREHAASQTLGELPGKVVTVRELVSRFEICHFKVKEHYRHILESVVALSPAVDPRRIGSAHPRLGGDAWMKDTTGRSEMGMQYVLALRSWLGEEASRDLEGLAEVQELVDASLGEKSDEKIRLVNLLLDRLLDRDLEKHLSGGKLSGLKLQLLACDICHYAFPQYMKQAISAIGKLQPASDFEGCGSANAEVTSFARREFGTLSAWLAGKDLEEGGLRESALGQRCRSNDDDGEAGGATASVSDARTFRMAGGARRATFVRRRRDEQNAVTKIRELAQTGTIVFTMRHRSFIDYFFVYHVLRREGLPLPVFANGVSTWPLAPFRDILARLRTRIGQLFTGRGREAAESAHDICAQAVRQGGPVLIFMRGRRTRSGIAGWLRPPSPTRVGTDFLREIVHALRGGTASTS